MCVIFLLFLVFLIYRKLRLTKQRLDYEVSDVRNMANVANFSSPVNTENMAKSSSMNMIPTDENNGTKANKYMTLNE